MSNDSSTPAFPVHVAIGPAGDVYHSGQVIEGGEGMTLRDWFAAQAMNGFASNSKSISAAIKVSEKMGREAADVLASDAYVFADAMLKARKS